MNLNWLSRRKSLVSCVTVFFLLFVIVILRYQTLPEVSSYFSFSPMTDESKVTCENFNAEPDKFWIGRNYEQLNIPEELFDDANSVYVVEKTVIIDNVTIFYRTGSSEKESEISVLFLHGSNFNSKVWTDVYSLQMCTAFGYRTVAVDLPGHGKSSEVSRSAKNDFLFSLIEALNLKRPVIISPSMSGIYSIPYIVKHWEEISGFVPVSPVGADLLMESRCGGSTLPVKTRDHYCSIWLKPLELRAAADVSCIKVPVMVVVGEHDNKLNSARMCQLPLSSGVVITRGNHAAYMNNPELWNLVLYNFLEMVNKKEICSSA